MEAAIFAAVVIILFARGWDIIRKMEVDYEIAMNIAAISSLSTNYSVSFSSPWRPVSVTAEAISKIPRLSIGRPSYVYAVGCQGVCDQGSGELQRMYNSVQAQLIVSDSTSLKLGMGTRVGGQLINYVGDTSLQGNGIIPFNVSSVLFIALQGIATRGGIAVPYSVLDVSHMKAVVDLAQVLSQQVAGSPPTGNSEGLNPRPPHFVRLLGLSHEF